MIIWLINWLSYILPGLFASIATLEVWRRSGHLGYALVSGTLARTISALFMGFLVWQGAELCEVCAQGSRF